MILFVRSRAVTGLPGLLSAMDKYYAERDIALLPRGRLYTSTSRALIAIFGHADAPSPKRALSVSQLLAILPLLSPSSPADVCFWAMLTVAFWGLLGPTETVLGLWGPLGASWSLLVAPGASWGLLGSLGV